MLDTTNEVENFCLFSGLVGYTLQLETIESLVRRAIADVDQYYRVSTFMEEPVSLSDHDGSII